MFLQQQLFAISGFRMQSQIHRSLFVVLLQAMASQLGGSPEVSSRPSRSIPSGSEGGFGATLWSHGVAPKVPSPSRWWWCKKKSNGFPKSKRTLSIAVCFGKHDLFAIFHKSTCIQHEYWHIGVHIMHVTSMYKDPGGSIGCSFCI